MSAIMSYIIGSYRYFKIDPDRVSTRGLGGGGVLGLNFAGYMPLASQSPYLIIVYSLANYNIYRPHLSHFWAHM